MQESFERIYQRAVDCKGGEAALENLLPQPKSPLQLQKITDDRYLAEMTKCVFRAGFVWQIVEKKWPGFEEAFEGFDTMACAMMSDEELERLTQNPAIVRNATKIRSVRKNANFVREIKSEHGCFGNFIAAWPEEDIVGLWAVLKKRGDRLGGNSRAYFLRFVGKDTFIFAGDVVRVLIAQGVIDKAPTSNKALAAVQRAFNTWHDQSGRPLSQISRILAVSVG